MHLVGVGKRPEPVEEAELRAVERFLASGLPVEPWPFLRTGQVVEVDQGSLSGMKGTLLEIKNAYRLVVSLTLLQRSVAVEIDRDCVRPISSTVLARSASA
jgi:transcription antitermination factor NusG